jgi:hypothetical protein
LTSRLPKLMTNPSFRNRIVLLHRFAFNDDEAFYEQVDTQFARQALAFVHERYHLLSLNA